jgi:hypothetical protein
MNLKRYLAFVEDIVYARKDVSVESFLVEEIEPEATAIVEGRLRYWDGSLFKFIEHLVVYGAVLTKTRYAYHYQDGEDMLVFRYDNVAHHPEVATHPHHKHVRIGASANYVVVSASPPSFADVLHEIDAMMYREG